MVTDPEFEPLMATNIHLSGGQTIDARVDFIRCGSSTPELVADRERSQTDPVERPRRGRHGSRKGIAEARATPPAKSLVRASVFTPRIFFR